MVKAQLDRTVVPFSPRHRRTKVALVEATKYKANPATDEVCVENQPNRGFKQSLQSKDSHYLKKNKLEFIIVFIRD